MSTELLPCPFCGGADIRITDHGNIGTDMLHKGQRVYTMACYSCGGTCLNGGMYEDHGRQKLIEAWNRRATQPPAPAEAKELVDWLSSNNGAAMLATTAGREAIAFLIANQKHSPVPEQAQPAGVTDTERLDWIIDNATTRGGGQGFTLTVFIPHDSECVRGAIDAARAQEGEKP